ncbi:MAG: ribosome maturation factor RimM [Prochloraceae cyanobacterium]|nr:ribosome maturation factor RimM [Prochloraceae cyanobacterium]
MNDEWLEIGTIVAAQGIKGLLRVLPSTDFPARFEQPGQRWLQFDPKKSPRSVELVRGNQMAGKNLYIVELAGIEDRNQAENLKGCKLLIPKSDRPELEEDEYHISDLIDLEVYHQLTGENIGKVIDVFSAGNDLLEIKLYQSPKAEEKKAMQTPIDVKRKGSAPSKKKNKNPRVFIPFVKEIVPVVDLESGRIEINPPLGLLEVNQN